MRSKYQKDRNLINTSNSMIKPVKLFTPEIISNPKYKELTEKFAKLFQVKEGLFLTSNFDKNVWFLRNDILFQSTINKKQITNTTPTPTPNSYTIGNNNNERNRLHEILHELNESTDFHHMSINVEKFIYKIVELLLVSKKTSDRSQANIDTYNAVERKQIIDEKLNIINQKVNNNNNYNKTFDDYISTFNSRVSRIEKLSEFGDYEFVLKYSEIVESNDNSGDMKLNQNTFNIYDSINVQRPNVNVTQKSDFPTIKFNTVSQKNNSNSILKFNANSGTSFSFFIIKAYQKGTNIALESKKAYLLDIMLNTIDNILEIEKSSFKESLEIKLNPLIGNNTIEEGKIVLDCVFEFDLITRASILNKINTVFKEVINTKTLSDGTIYEVLNFYFSEIRDGVYAILEKKGEERKDACCDCIIY